MEDLALSKRDPRSSIYKQPPGITFSFARSCNELSIQVSDRLLTSVDLAALLSQTLQSHPVPGWKIKTYSSQGNKLSSSTITRHLCHPTPPVAQAPSSQLTMKPQPLNSQLATILPAVNTQPSTDPFSAAWDAGSPDERGRFLQDVLVTPVRLPSHFTCLSQQQQQQQTPHSSSMAPSLAVPAVPAEEVRESEVGKHSVAAIQAPSVSQETVSVCSTDSDAATVTADFSHASSAQPGRAVRASLQTASSQKRSRAESEQTDAQTAPPIIATQRHVGRPAKKKRGLAEGKPTKKKLMSAEVVQAARERLVFAKYARFAYWPAQVSLQIWSYGSVTIYGNAQPCSYLPYQSRLCIFEMAAICRQSQLKVKQVLLTIRHMRCLSEVTSLNMGAVRSDGVLAMHCGVDHSLLPLAGCLQRAMQFFWDARPMSVCCALSLSVTAQILIPNEQQQRDLGANTGDQVFVVFFGQSNYQYIGQDRVISFEAGLAKYKPGKSSLDLAVKEAIAYVKVRTAE